MSTNYYLSGLKCPHPCEHCAIPNYEHLGKQVGVGQGTIGFLLQAYDNHSMLGEVQSWQQMASALRSLAATQPEAVVEADDGGSISVEEFINTVNGTDPWGIDQAIQGGDFRDSEGWAFIPGGGWS